MTAPSLRSHIAAVLGDPSDPDALEFADVLLADSALKAIIDLAAWIGNDQPTDKEAYEECPQQSPEVRALLADWRAERP